MDKRLFIIGGGASVNGVLANPELKARLEQETIIGCNVAPKYIRCDYLVYFDNTFESEHQDMIDSFEGMIYAPATAQHPKSNPKINFRKHLEIPSTNEKNGLCFKLNAGCGALALALALAKQDTKDIYLIGFDMNHTGDQKNFHKEYIKKGGKREKEREFEHMLTSFDTLAAFVIDKLPHVIVWNCNKDSRLSKRDYPYISLEEVLYG